MVNRYIVFLDGNTSIKDFIKEWNGRNVSWILGSIECICKAGIVFPRGDGCSLTEFIASGNTVFVMKVSRVLYGDKSLEGKTILLLGGVFAVKNKYTIIQTI